MRPGAALCICLLMVPTFACGSSPPPPTRLTRLAGITPGQLESMRCRNAARDPLRPAVNRDRFCTGVVGESRAAVHVDPRARVYRVTRSWSTSSEARWRQLSDSVRTALVSDARTVRCAELDDLPFVHTELLTSLNALVEIRTIEPADDDGYEVRNYELRVAIIEGAAGECTPEGTVPGARPRASA